MNNVLAICNLHDSPKLGLLTENRPLGSTTFLGRYGLMDFTLSNFTNSGFHRLAILVESHFDSVNSHIRNGNIWVKNTKTGFLSTVFNEKGIINQKFNTDIENLRINRYLFENFKYFDTFVFAPPFFLTKMDYSNIVTKHRESGADVTIVYTKTMEGSTKYINCDTLRIRKDGTVIGVDKNTGNYDELNISLETFIISKDAFDKINELQKVVSSAYNFRQMINYCIREKLLNIKAYNHKEEVYPILSFDDYVNISFKLLPYEERCKLFDTEWPIYTTTHNTPPSLYGPYADVKNSFIANGAIINGKVENSIISRGVIVDKGAEIKNSIIFTKTHIGENKKINYVFTDKVVKVTEVDELLGNEKQMLFVRKGEKV